jgi:hypothetical protein
MIFCRQQKPSIKGTINPTTPASYVNAKIHIVTSSGTRHHPVSNIHQTTNKTNRKYQTKTRIPGDGICDNRNPMLSDR